MKYISHFFQELIFIFNEMSPYLLLGFFVAGLLYIYFPKSKVQRYMGNKSLGSVINASLFGVPLPLCSCGVIPTGVSFYKNGASKGSAVSFLISTPQTGVDSILVTYSLLGLPLAIIRPIIAFFTGIIGGILTNVFDKDVKPIETPEKESTCSDETCTDSSCHTDTNEKRGKVYQMFKYAFVDFLNDISKWLVIGLLIAAVISVLIPNDFFSSHISSPLLSMLIILVASVPLYVCATASVPIAAVLMMKGISPGAALVFLMAGPATNAATITVIGNALGKKSLFTYLISIIGGALFFGLLIDYTLPADWFQLPINPHTHHHHHEIIPAWLQTISSIILLSLIVNGYLYKRRKQKQLNQTKRNDMTAKIFKVTGMSCNHCKNNVESNIMRIGGIDSVEVNLDKQEVCIEGEFETKDVQAKIEGLGYKFEGEAK